MRLSSEGARWFIWIRWLACVGLFLGIWAGTLLEILAAPLPLYFVGLFIVAYNAALHWAGRENAPGERNVEREILIQVLLDLAALTLVLYFSDISRNPFLFYFVFHMIIASMYLHGRLPYVIAGIATALVGCVMVLEAMHVLPTFALRFPGEAPGRPAVSGLELLGVFVAFASTIWFTVYFTTRIHRYVDRAHEEMRQKEKMVGIGQLVAGIGHQIANPLDGLQNGLTRLGERVKDDPHLVEYVEMMREALNRIERTTKRVQSFARPRGIELQPTDVNAAVEATLGVLGARPPGIRVETQLGDVPAVHGDPYTLQEVLFNLCTNALHAMPNGGALTITTRVLEKRKENCRGTVAVDVSDTGVGIPRVQLDKIFEPFFTTRAESGGTGLGLGLCRMLINEMGGRIEVRTALGQGTTFTVVLNQMEEATA